MKRLLSTVVVLTSVFSSLSAQDFTDFRVPEHIVSPETVGDTVILRLAGEYATDVRVEGSWTSGQLPMQKREGVWELKLGRLPADVYTYRFFVEGVPALDPSNPSVQRLGTEYRSFFSVDSPYSRLYGDAVRRGSVSYVWYESGILGMERRMAVYTPYGYGNDEKRQYPVLYLMHGEGDDEESWLTMGRLAQVLDNLIQQGRAVPMVVVMPNCNAVEQASFMLGLPERSNVRTNSSFIFMNSLVHEIIPYVESRYNVIPKKAGRAVCGIGDTGTALINAAILYPDLFDFLIPLSCGVVDNGHLTDDFLRIKRAGVKLFWTGCGTMDREAYERSRTLHDALQLIHLDHTFYMLTGGRDWRTWRLFLCNFAPMLFKHYTY